MLSKIPNSPCSTRESGLSVKFAKKPIFLNFINNSPEKNIILKVFVLIVLIKKIYFRTPLISKKELKYLEGAGDYIYSKNNSVLTFRVLSAR
jgi:hypothetical protein